MKKFKKGLLLVTLLITLTGCTKYVTNDDKKNVKNVETGQQLTANILCKPTDKKLLELYEEYGDKLTVPMDKLPECETMKFGDLKYNGLWESLFVKPLALIIIWIGKFIGNYGLSVMLIGILIRVILMPITSKSLAQSKKMKDAKDELTKIEKKYENKTDKESQMKKSEETLKIYQKHGINPLSSCLGAVIQLPLFFGFLEAINRVPAIFEGKFLSLGLGMTPYVGIASKNYWYILLIVLIIISTYFSFSQSMKQTAVSEDQQNQTKFMTYFMLVFIAYASLHLPTAIALYWIATNVFAIVQHFIMKRDKKERE